MVTAAASGPSPRAGSSSDLASTKTHRPVYALSRASAPTVVSNAPPAPSPSNAPPQFFRAGSETRIKKGASVTPVLKQRSQTEPLREPGPARRTSSTASAASLVDENDRPRQLQPAPIISSVTPRHDPYLFATVNRRAGSPSGISPRSSRPDLTPEARDASPATPKQAATTTQIFTSTPPNSGVLVPETQMTPRTIATLATSRASIEESTQETPEKPVTRMVVARTATSIKSPDVEQARSQRKILDLEITNNSLLSVNRYLERQLRKQSREVERLKELRAAWGSNGADLSDLEYSDSDSELDIQLAADGSGPAARIVERTQEHIRQLQASQEYDRMLRRCLLMSEALIRDGEESLQVRTANIKLGGKVAFRDESDESEG